MFGVLTGLLLLGILVLSALNRNAPDFWAITDFPWSPIGAVAYGLVGALLARRRPGNVLGWLFLVIGLNAAATSLVSNWAVYGLETRPGMSGADLALWLGLGLGALGLAPIFPILLFPTGRLPDWPSRLLAVVAGAATLLLTIFLLSGNTAPPGFPDVYERTPNPLAQSEPLGDPGLMIMLLGITGLLAVGQLVFRFRRSRGLARQQYKWVVLAMTFVVITFIADFFARALDTGLFVITSPLLSMSIFLIPVSMGIAILRHHLYDIDRIVNRTLVYALLSFGLLGTYGLGVIVLQSVLQPHTRGSDFTVAATTLLVAALFRPLRSKIQRTVDRRFNRAHYDAAQTIEAFSTRLRDQVDLNTVTVELQAIVTHTLQPERVTLWVRPIKSA